MTQAASDSDDEEEWEHVEMEKSPDDADVNRPSDEHPKADLSNGLDITIEGIKRKPGVSKEQKYLQLYLHQAHTFFLLMSAVLRNRECDHFEVQAMVLSLIPQSIHMLFGCTDDVILAGEVRQEFCSRLEQLTEWFRSEFSVARNSVYGEVEVKRIPIFGLFVVRRMKFEACTHCRISFRQILEHARRVYLFR